jgi:hypothetical protein
MSEPTQPLTEVLAALHVAYTVGLHARLLSHPKIIPDLAPMIAEYAMCDQYEWLYAVLKVGPMSSSVHIWCGDYVYRVGVDVTMVIERANDPGLEETYFSISITTTRISNRTQTATIATSRLLVTDFLSLINRDARGRGIVSSIAAAALDKVNIANATKYGRDAEVALRPSIMAGLEAAARVFAGEKMNPATG